MRRHSAADRFSKASLKPLYGHRLDVAKRVFTGCLHPFVSNELPGALLSGESENYHFD
jgi:hypothetical protein